MPIESTGSRVVDLLGASWKYSGTGGTVLRLQPNSSSDVVFGTPQALTVTQSSFNPAPSELASVSVGDILVLESDTVTLPSTDGDYLKGQVVKVSRNEGGIVQFYPNIIDNYTVQRVKIVGKTEGTKLSNINWDCQQNVSNNSILDVIWQSSVSLTNTNIIGSGFQNIGLKVSGVDVVVSACSVVGVANNNNAPGYGVAIDGTNISVNAVSGTKCRHLVDGGSRQHYTVNLNYTDINASKDDGASDNNYILGFHANCRGFSMIGCNISGNGNLMQIRGGEGVISGCNFLSIGSNIYSDIQINEEGCRNVVIDSNTFTNALGVSGNTCVRLSTSQDNKNLIVTNNTVSGDDKVLVEIRNNGHDTKGVLIDGNVGSPNKLLFTEDSTTPPPPTDLEVTVSNNVMNAENSEVGFYVSFLNDYKNLSVNLVNNEINYLTGSGMFGITGDITGNLDLTISNNKTKNSAIDSYVIKPTNVSLNMSMDFSHNKFAGQFEFDVTATTYGPMLFIANDVLRAVDAIVITNADLPIVFQNNMNNDSQSWRNVKTLYPEAMIGNVNTSTGYVTANGYKDYGVRNYPDGTWRSAAIPSTYPLNYKGIDSFRQRDFTVGNATGWVWDGAAWRALANL